MLPAPDFLPANTRRRNAAGGLGGNASRFTDDDEDDERDGDRLLLDPRYDSVRPRALENGGRIATRMKREWRPNHNNNEGVTIPLNRGALENATVGFLLTSDVACMLGLASSVNGRNSDLETWAEKDETEAGEQESEGNVDREKKEMMTEDREDDWMGYICIFIYMCCTHAYYFLFIHASKLTAKEVAMIAGTYICVYLNKHSIY